MNYDEYENEKEKKKREKKKRITKMAKKWREKIRTGRVRKKT